MGLEVGEGFEMRRDSPNSVYTLAGVVTNFDRSQISTAVYN